ncbi:hypothetical protein DMR38_02070 [Clostridium sp. AWRP]|nr:hypothetical protein DMR38_02070 [Clostridium sp. AWRP]
MKATIPLLGYLAFLQSPSESKEQLRLWITISKHQMEFKTLSDAKNSVYKVLLSNRCLSPH